MVLGINISVLVWANADEPMTRNDTIMMAFFMIINDKQIYRHIFKYPQNVNLDKTKSGSKGRFLELKLPWANNRVRTGDPQCHKLVL